MTDRGPPDLGALFGDDTPSPPAAPVPRVSAASFLDDDDTPLLTSATPVGFLSEDAKAEAKAAADAAWKASRQAAQGAWKGLRTNGPVVGAALDDFLVANRQRLAMALALIVIVEVLMWSLFGGTPHVAESAPPVATQAVVAPPPSTTVVAPSVVTPPAPAPVAVVPDPAPQGLAGDSPEAVNRSDAAAAPSPAVAVQALATRPVAKRPVPASPAKSKPADAEEAARMDAWFKELKEKQR